MKYAYGIDKLRSAVTLFSNCNESFNQCFTATELLALYQAYDGCGYDITPDMWSEAQVKAALNGGPFPAFTEEQLARYG